MSTMRMVNHHYHHHHHFGAHALLLAFLLTFPRLLLCRSYSITSATWTWRGRYPIAYEQAQVVADAARTETTTTTTTTATTTTTPVLLLNGFGVGSFHQHRLIHELLGKHNNNSCNDNIVVYCIDYLGQGASWPVDCNDGQGAYEVGLQYSGNTWVDQITDFIRDVILQNHDNKRKVHIVGNSVGGHLATYVAAKIGPQWIESLCLLNPTPFWGLNLPGWNGVLPAPPIPKMIGRFMFDQIRDLTNIERFLMQVYANNHHHGAFDETLMQQIRACTNGPGGHAAFASILWSPPVSVAIPSSSLSNINSEEDDDKKTTTINNFYDCLAFLANKNNSSKNRSLPILLVFGHGDPWCKPALARRMLEQATTNSNSIIRYIEMTNVGHCPNHEAPIATAHVLNAWWRQQQQHFNNDDNVAASQDKTQRLQRQPLLRLPHDGTTGMSIQESWGTTRLQEKSRDEISLNLVDRLTTAFV